MNGGGGRDVDRLSEEKTLPKKLGDFGFGGWVVVGVPEVVIKGVFGVILYFLG